MILKEVLYYKELEIVYSIKLNLNHHCLSRRSFEGK